MTAKTNTSPIGKSISMPRLLLHIEGLVILMGSLLLYTNQNFKWGTFALLLLTPDMPLIFYGIDKRLASILYNLVHSLIFPMTLGFFSLYTGSDFSLQLALIWFAHIGMDHIFGYGFKYLGSFKETHFSRI